jgi:hypothetical protein
LNKLDVFHKTNLLWIIAVKKSNRDPTRFIRSLTRELEKQFFDSDSSKPERYLGQLQGLAFIMYSLDVDYSSHPQLWIIFSILIEKNCGNLSLLQLDSILQCLSYHQHDDQNLVDLLTARYKTLMLQELQTENSNVEK